MRGTAAAGGGKLAPEPALSDKFPGCGADGQPLLYPLVFFCINKQRHELAESEVFKRYGRPFEEINVVTADGKSLLQPDCYMETGDIAELQLNLDLLVPAAPRELVDKGRARQACDIERIDEHPTDQNAPPAQPSIRERVKLAEHILDDDEPEQGTQEHASADEYPVSAAEPEQGTQEPEQGTQEHASADEYPVSAAEPEQGTQAPTSTRCPRRPNMRRPSKARRSTQSIWEVAQSCLPASMASTAQCCDTD
jgi:hypothetical protein